MCQLIAQRVLHAVAKDSRAFELRVGVGLPYLKDSEDEVWACPVALDGLYESLPDIPGADSWQVITLAMTLIHSLLFHFVEEGGKLYWEKGGQEVSVRELFGAAEYKFEPNPPLSEVQQARVRQLSTDQLRVIDESILANASSRFRKVAYIVMKVMDTHSSDLPGVPDLYFAERVRSLVTSGKLESQGDLTGMRFSEVRLPQISTGALD